MNLSYFLRHVISYLLEEDEGVNKPEVMDSSKVVRSSEMAEMFSTLLKEKIREIKITLYILLNQ